MSTFHSVSDAVAWAAVIGAVCGAAITGTVAMVGHAISLKGLRQAHQRWEAEQAASDRRREVDHERALQRLSMERGFVVLDQALDRVLSPDEKNQLLGMAQFRALAASKSVEPGDLELMRAALKAALHDVLPLVADADEVFVDPMTRGAHDVGDSRRSASEGRTPPDRAATAASGDLGPLDRAGPGDDLT